MKKINIILFLILFSTITVFGQSKKEQIATLNKQVVELQNQISEKNIKITNLSVQNEELKNSINTNKVEVQQLNSKINDLETKIKELNKTINELSEKIYNKTPENNAEWISIEKNQSENKFSLTKKLQVLFKNELIEGDILNEKHDKISVSPISENERFVFCCTFDEDLDWAGFYLCDLEKMTSFKLDIWYPMFWVSWSPLITNVLFATYYEADMTLYNIDLINLKINELDFSDDILKEKDEYSDNPQPLEEMTFELENIKWVDKYNVKIKANITCHSYTVDDCNREIIKHSFIYIYDTKNNKIISKNKIKN